MKKEKHGVSIDGIYAHVWNDAGVAYRPFPGTLATLVEGTENIYQFTVPEEFEGGWINFNNGISSGVNRISTLECRIPEDGGYIFRVSTEDSRIVYFEYTWGENVNIHMWNDVTGEETEWPGVPAESVPMNEGMFRYYFTLPEKYNHFLFCWIVDGIAKYQSRDFAFVGGDRIYRSGYDPQETSVLSNGHWEKYEE